MPPRLAYLRTMKMGKRGKEPDVSEFISANNAQMMVMVCSGVAGSTTLALVAAACQTGGRIVCIFPCFEYSTASEKALGSYADGVKFVVGDAKTLLRGDYKGTDFALIDCNVTDHEGVFRAAQEGAASGPGGLLVTRVGGAIASTNKVGGGSRKRSRWIVKVDKWTGEEHVFRVTAPPSKEINA
ncbi:hypothetical protein SLEP1_g24003 [Rubroshorea leprosula]|uniref:Uncharacterized protein n=1 Tax=Rubroshorea leprosula TaxID=152421 RepID=A0AAV5JLH8_9ROSI|nr:hypothetical protein SLEP1_g24003 [Rubroshorea leprosula]